MCATVHAFLHTMLCFIAGRRRSRPILRAV